MLSKKIEIYKYLKNILINIVKPNLVISKVNDLTEEDIDKMISDYNISGVILDIDNTLRFNLQDIPDYNKEWLTMIRHKLPIIIVSNGLDRNIALYFDSIGVAYLGLAYKPFKVNFKRACHMLNSDSKNILLIGDNLITDIYGGKKMGMKTVMINKYNNHVK